MYVYRQYIKNLHLQSTIWNESKGRLMQALSPPASPKRDGSPNSSNSSHNDEDQTRYTFLNILTNSYIFL